MVLKLRDMVDYKLMLKFKAPTSEELEQLKQIRDNNERKSEEVLSIVRNLNVEKIKNKNERFMVIEQALYAALDAHVYRYAVLMSMLLSKEFPGSTRVMRHQAAVLEAEERYDEALEVLDYIIKMDETNSAARKRRVAILKAQGLISEAIKELVDYLKKFMSDVEAWQELSELYLASGEFGRAAFCAEEMILHQPHSHLLHQRLADIRYTMGGVENMELAKTYYCQALKLNPDNLRALLGLFLSTNSLLNLYKSSGNSAKRKEALKLCQWAHSCAARPQPDLESALQNLAITD